MRARKKKDEHSWLLTASVLIVIGTALLYFWVLTSWLMAPSTPAVAAPTAQADTPPAPLISSSDASLEIARRTYRDGLLEAKNWLALSEALSRAGRPFDAFYVTYAAREFFGDDEFFAAHRRSLPRDAAPVPAPLPPDEELALAERVKTDPSDAAAAAALARSYIGTERLTSANKILDGALTLKPDDGRLLLAKAQALSVSDPSAAIPFYARSAHSDMKAPEAKVALAALREFAGAREESSRGELSRSAREGLEELRKAHPHDGRVLAALAGAMLARGDRMTARALVVEGGRENGTAVAAVEGQLALDAHDLDSAVKAFTRAWEADPSDLLSADKLAVIYAQRGDEEAALPYLVALYRRDPRRLRGVEPLDQAIRRLLDVRRRALLKDVNTETLGRFLKSEDASLRAEACVRAAELKDARWIDRLSVMLDDDTEIVRRNADYALYQLAKLHSDAVASRRDDWLRSERALLRARALNLFADLWPTETLPRARLALIDENPAVRYFAKALVFDRYYKKGDRALSDYLAREKNPLVLARFAYDKKRPAR